MTEEAGMKKTHLHEAEYCPRMVANHDTNLKLLMAEYERLSKLDPDDHIFKSSVNYSFKPCSSMDINDRTRVTLEDLTKFPNEFHRQRFFVCRTITAFIRSHSLLSVVETPDPSGEYQGTLLSISNNIRPVDKTNQSCDSFLSSGTIVVVKNPLYTKSSYDFFYTVKCDNPCDVFVLEQELFCGLFPNLKWPSREPQTEERFSLIKQWWRWLWSSPTNDWKKVAELRLEKENYHGALEAYDLALGCNPRDIEVLTLRSALYFRLQMYQKSLKDSETALEIETGNITAIYCKALSYISLRRYKLALQFLETHIQKCRLSADVDHEEKLFKLQCRAKAWRKQGECGEYDFAKMLECPFTCRHDCANFYGNVRRQDIVGKGKGVVATADIQCGELLIAEKAFVIEHSNDAMLKTTYHTSVETELRRNIHATLIESIAYRLVLDPDLGKDFYGLFDGTQSSVSKQTEAVEENDCIDMKRINSICSYNCYFSDMGTSTDGNHNYLQGLWIFGSYFNHSCYDANSVNIISGDVIFIRACRNIKKNEEICIAYLSCYMPYPERVSALSGYGFVCQCTLCQLDSKDSDAIHIRRQELLNEIIKIKPESSSKVSNTVKLIAKLTSLRQEDSNRNICIQEPLMELARCYVEVGDYKRAANIYHSVQNLCCGTVMIETSLMSGYNALVCYMSSGQTEEATRCVKTLKAALIQMYGTDSRDVMNYVPGDLALLMTLCETNH